MTSNFARMRDMHASMGYARTRAGGKVRDCWYYMVERSETAKKKLSSKEPGELE